MAYVRFVPGFSRHPKRIKVGPVSSWLWACSVDYCSEFLTDGFIENQAVKGLIPSLSARELKQCIANLISVGSWEQVPGGYQVHDYLKYNLSKTQVQADQAAGRRRYDHWLTQRRSEGMSNGVGNAVATPSPNGVSSPPTALPTALGAPSPTLLTVFTGITDIQKPLLEARPIAHAMGPEIDPDAHEAKRAAARQLLKRAFPDAIVLDKTPAPGES